MHISIPPPPLLQSSTRIARPVKESIVCDANRDSDITVKASNVNHGNINGAAKLNEEFAYKLEHMVENPPNRLPEQYDQKTYILGKLPSNQLFNNSEQPNSTYFHMGVEMGGNNRSTSFDFSTTSLPPTKLIMDKSNSKPFQNTEINTVFSTLQSEQYLHGNRSEGEANVNFDWSSVNGHNKYEFPLNSSSSNEIQQIRNYEASTANLSRINNEQSNGFFVTTHNRFSEGKNSNMPLTDKSNYLFSESTMNLEENRSTRHTHGNYTATNNPKEFCLNSGEMELSKPISLKNNHTGSRLPPKLPTISTNIIPTPINHTETDVRDTGNLEFPNFNKGGHEIIPERGKLSTRPPTAPIFSSVDNSIHLNRNIVLENIQDCRSQTYIESELVDINEISPKHDISQDLTSSFQKLSLKSTSSQLLPNNASPFINKSNLDTDKLRPPPSACVSVTRPPTAPNNNLGPHPKVEMLMNLMDRTVKNKKREFEKLNRLKSALSELGDFNKRLLEENIRLKSANLNTDCEKSIKSEVVNQKVLNTKLSIDNDIDNNSNREVELLQSELYKKDEIIKNLQNKLISKNSFDKVGADQMISTYMKIFKKIEQKSLLFKESVDDINNLLSNIIGLAGDSVELLDKKTVENLNRLSSDIIHQIEFNYSALKVTLNHLSDRQQIILGSMTRIDNLEISDKKYSNINIEDHSSANLEGNRSPTYKFKFESNDECNNVMEEASNILDYNGKAETSYSHSINGLFSHTNDDLSTTGNNKNLVDINLLDGDTYPLDQLSYSQSQFDSVSLENQKPPPVETVYNGDSNTSWNYDQPYDLRHTISDIDYIHNYNAIQSISSSKATV
ncbi:hypothetical protein ACR3K2_10360 [Cryptosporidium serpentis]